MDIDPPGCFVWDTHFVDSKDALMAGQLRTGTSRVVVLADGVTDSRLIAESMVGARGMQPTGADLIDFPV